MRYPGIFGFEHLKSIGVNDEEKDYYPLIEVLWKRHNGKLKTWVIIALFTINTTQKKEIISLRNVDKEYRNYLKDEKHAAVEMAARNIRDSVQARRDRSNTIPVTPDTTKQ